MTLTTLELLTLGKLNDSTGTYYPDTSGALNEAQRVFVLLSLCLEKTASFALTGGQLSYNVLTQLPDFVLPRRVYNSSGQQMRPATIAQLEALDSDWQGTAGVPLRYVARGLDWLAVYPQPPSADTLSIVYACCPTTLAAGDDTPGIRMQSQYSLVNYASWALRQPEGGQEFAKFAGYLKEFMGEAVRVAALVRERNKDAGYETVGPFELERVK
jgi:hypothetical protein